MAVDTRAAAKAFVRSLNILLKFARLYEFGHVRTTAQFQTTWRELSGALQASGGSGILLGASGNQILLDGEPLGSGAAERSFAQLLSSSGIASIHFSPSLTQPQFARFARAFPTGNTKPAQVAEQLKSALAGDSSIKVNEIRYVAEDSSIAGVKVAAQLTATVLGAHGDKFKEMLEDPQKMLQLILAAEGTRGPGGGPGGGGGGGPAWGGGSGTGGTGGGGGSNMWESGRSGGGTGGGGGSGTGGGSGGSGGGAGSGSGSGGTGGVGYGSGGGSGTGGSSGVGIGPGGGAGTGTGGGGSSGGAGGGSGSGGSGGAGSGPGGGAGSSGGGTGIGGGRGTGGAGGGSGSGGSGGGGSGPGGGAGPGGGSGGLGVGPGATGGGAAPGESAAPGRWAAASAMLRGGSAGPLSSIPTHPGGFNVAEDDVRSMLSLFAQLGRSRKDPESKLDVPTFQSRLSAMPVRAQYTLQQALAGLAAQAPTEQADKPMLLRLAEHVAIRFALDSYERGELRVNAVKQLLDRMNQEIEALRKILGHHEEAMAHAGLSVQSFTELLDQEFWEQVPEENKKEVLTSDEAWCVPPRNVRAFLEEMLRRGELKTVNEVLVKYAACIALEAPEARRTTAIGLADLAEFYGSGDGSALMEAIRRVGNQLAAEREPELQTLVSAAFVRLSQEAASKRCYPAMQQTLASLDTVEAQRPGSSQAIRPRIGAEDRLPEFIEEALRNGEIADGMLEILNLMPGATLRYIVNRFAGCGFREDCELLGKIVQGLGEESVHSLEGTLQTAPAAEAVETVGLLCMLSSDFVEKVLPMRLAQWPRTAHDRVVRQVSAASPQNRAKLLVSSYDSLDMFIRPLAIDEMGMSGQPECIPLLLRLAAGDGIPGYTRLKAVEALGRLRAQGASGTLQHILEAKQVWRWGYPMELRIAAAQALMRIDPTVAFDRMAAGGLERRELTLEPTEPESGSSVVRQRRYARLKLSRNLAAVTTNLQNNFRLTIPEINLGGGLGASERHMAPGSLITLKISAGVRHIKAQAIVRGARQQAIAFEFVDMDLEDRLRLRKLLMESGAMPQVATVGNRSRRRGRPALHR